MSGHSRQKLDLAGQKYGRLTILGPAENVGIRTAWRCRCDCGVEVVVRTDRLRSGHTSSCGCMGPGTAPGGGLPGLTTATFLWVQGLDAQGHYSHSDGY